MRAIDAEPIMKFIENGLNETDPQKQFGHDAIEIMTEIEYAPTIEPPANWTPCSDGRPRPKNKQWVLGMIDPSPECGDDAEMAVVRYNKRRDEYTDDQGSVVWIYAWSDLPKRPPYRGEA